jgi:nicotinamidase-related amidase
MIKHTKLINRKKSALLVIDIQEKILPVIFQCDRVVENSIKLIKGFKSLGLPVYYTEQYPKGLGSTLLQVKEALEDARAIEKMSFSCCGAPGLFEELQNKKIEQVVLCGVEAHVCVLQTALDLAANGFQVHIAADAVSSRREFDFNIALNRMQSNSAQVSLTESVLFELLEVCGTDQFKFVSKLVK